MGNYEEFKTAVYQLTKIDLNSYKERQMKRRIDALITKHRFKDYKEFVGALRTDKALLEEFVTYLTINVSEFFRNPEQWKTLEHEVIPELLKLNNGKPLKIWSAACSTGEEPYSLVMMLSKYMPLDKIKIIATDIDKQVLEKAQLGLYQARTMKSVPEEYQKKYFNTIDERTVQISDQVRKRVEFRKHDMLREAFPDCCDLIVCRNVMIYFTDDAKTYLYKKFNESLKKDGVLFIGSTEQVVQAAELGYQPFRSFFYRKK